MGPLVCLSTDQSHFLALPGQINLFLLTKSLVLLHLEGSLGLLWVCGCGIAWLCCRQCQPHRQSYLLAS